MHLSQELNPRPSTTCNPRTSLIEWLSYGIWVSQVLIFKVDFTNILSVPRKPVKFHLICINRAIRGWKGWWNPPFVYLINMIRVALIWFCRIYRSTWGQNWMVDKAEPDGHRRGWCWRMRREISEAEVPEISLWNETEGRDVNSRVQKILIQCSSPFPGFTRG